MEKKEDKSLKEEATIINKELEKEFEKIRSEAVFIKNSPLKFLRESLSTNEVLSKL